ncbi:79f92ae9-0d5a-48d4-a2a0-a3a87a7c627e [Thermothielavioides terrestris]|uniref:79f92ae9-0d5a-48d4-a2a0-a3a87a7c627e n=1 Tax=Thermothielavioides terrestris TaxID=2587410 RepID=A0A446BPS8_9PEZI|nr:79f92ae9-0d5a-48d4-a2a0-a3a87a7c627e [Thermothielavioides terrestris]
MSIADFENAS